MKPVKTVMFCFCSALSSRIYVQNDATGVKEQRQEPSMHVREPEQVRTSSFVFARVTTHFRARLGPCYHGTVEAKGSAPEQVRGKSRNK